MNPIEQLRDKIARGLHGVQAQVDAPSDKKAGRWILDVRVDPDSVWRAAGNVPDWIVVEWSRQNGFGLSTPGEDDYGLKPDELYPSLEATYARLVELLTRGGRTAPRVSGIADLRRYFGLTQEQLAERLGRKQPAIARLEQRPNVQSATLRRVLDAIAGEYSIVLRLPDRREIELTGPWKVLAKPPEPRTARKRNKS